MSDEPEPVIPEPPEPPIPPVPQPEPPEPPLDFGEQIVTRGEERIEAYRDAEKSE